ncbi:hypothetical protein [Micromonospora auratinigra]|uniref:hypothetical protein n=1 Tax=Micromonospora auratinigra TaxID=261654 RepID=UPI0012FDAF15|nr:hypothetical protein [Micromonospora auratinigra]
MLLLVLPTGGCTPPGESRAALRHLDDGRIELLAVVCEGHDAARLAVYENRSEGGGAGWVVETPLGSPPVERTQVLRVTLFRTPDGWQEQEGALDDLSPGTPYGLLFSDSAGQGSQLRFTLDRLTGLGDRVLTGPWRHERVVEESEFLDGARKSCDGA